MGKRTREFETLLARFDGIVAPEFLLFLRDLSQHREEVLAVGFLVDNLVKRGVALGSELVDEVDRRCGELGIDDKRRTSLRQLADQMRAKGAAAEHSLSRYSWNDIVAADDPVAFGRTHDVSEVMIVRALREKHGLSSSEAVALMRMASLKD